MKLSYMKNNHSDTNCSVAKTMKIIGSKWTILIIHNIMVGNNRFGLLQKNLSGISTKTLSVRLQELEREGIITKKIYNEIPLHVEYFLTEKGKSLKTILNQMERWGNATI